MNKIVAALVSCVLVQYLYDKTIMLTTVFSRKISKHILCVSFPYLLVEIE